MSSSPHLQTLLKYQTRRETYYAEQFKLLGVDLRFVHDDKGVMQEVLACPTASDPNFVNIARGFSELSAVLARMIDNQKEFHERFAAGVSLLDDLAKGGVS